ncbi:MAG: hypothetical protein WD065_02040 [Planctomycetaceae bacterium]
MVDWIKEHINPDPYEFLIPFRDRIRPRIKAIYKRRIFPLLPSQLRRFSAGERGQAENSFTWDFMEMAIESSLIERGMEPGLYSRLLPPYEAGRYPCGWEGSYPEGRVIVY